MSSDIKGWQGNDDGNCCFKQHGWMGYGHQVIMIGPFDCPLSKGKDIPWNYVMPSRVLFECGGQKVNFRPALIVVVLFESASE